MAAGVLDILEEDSRWFSWSADRLAECAEHSALIINPVIYAEVSVGFARIEEMEETLPHEAFTRRPLPWEAAFLAGKCFIRYRRAGGSRRSPLPDFFIGAHAAVEGLTLLTRDATRYRGYFPRLKLIAP
ncbi:MAG: type II toxin-antitoxin system VapC family toxin [Thermodesulfobacteriota bacterium]|jgi:predicted nucleic acid-binding protein